MQVLREEHRTGAGCLEAAMALLQRVRRAHATAGLLEAADLQWWWRAPRSTDELPQLFWFDQRGQPAAAVIATDWGDATALDPIVLPDATPEWIAQVIERGLAHAGQCGLGRFEVVVDEADHITRQVLAGHGFVAGPDPADAASSGLSVVSAWLAADARPASSRLHDGYRLCSRLDTLPSPHHLVRRSGAEVEARLRQTSLYRPELDLVVLDDAGQVAAYGLFWFDPESATGLVEPMRTEDGHQRRGLARHLLTAGIGRLADAGAARIKVCYRRENPAARDLYLGVGFVPDKRSLVLARVTS